MLILIIVFNFVLEKCPSFYSTATTTLKCVDRDGNKIGCDQAIDGTYLTFDCIAYYEVPPGNKRSLFCRAGTWDFPKPVCQPGKISSF